MVVNTSYSGDLYKISFQLRGEEACDLLTLYTMIVRQPENVVLMIKFSIYIYVGKKPSWLQK
jgi:hypothetical protein